MVKRNKELEICFMLYGYQIFLWRELRKIKIGPCFVLMKLLVFIKYMEQNLSNFMKSMRKKEKEERP